MRLLTIQKTIEENNLLIFTSLELQRFLDISKTATQKILERYTKKGVFVRLRKGYYALKSKPPSSFYIANVVYRPSYISFESALSYYGMIPESIFSITSATSKPTQTFQILGKNFYYLKIKKEAFTGYYKRQVNNESILIAEPEKALADYFYFVSLKKKKPFDRFYLKNISKKKFFQYLELFKKKGLKEIAQKYI
jgi:predicted transcriptional regulator of viral defense system